MYIVVLENEKGQQLQLTQNENKFTVDNIDGLTPPSASISLVDNTGDGAEFVHERTGARTIVINFYINGDVEQNRIELYKYIKNGKYIKMYFENGVRNVWVDGRVESIEIDQFAMNTSAQVSIVCPDPWWKDVEEVINSINTVKPSFIFPFSIVEPIPISVYEIIQILNLVNQGDVSSGVTIEITARGTIVNPIIFNRETKEYIGFGTEEQPYEMQGGDKIVITTHTNNKEAKLIRNAEEINIFNYLKEGSTFLQVSSGDNIFTYSADSGNENIDIIFKHYSNYEGV